MKRILMLLFIFTSIFTLSSWGDKEYDYIEDYTIYVDARDDGTLDISYKLKWHVLISGNEDYIDIGIPNTHANVLSFNNKDISDAYVIDSDGSHVRLDLYSSLKAGDIYNLEFKIHQDYMFTVGEENNNKYINYEFTPGWFDNSRVGKINVYWAKAGVIEADSTARDSGDYYLWSYRLDKGESISCRVYYNIDYFPNIDIDRAFDNDPLDKYEIYIIIGIVILVFGAVLIAVIVDKLHRENNYYATRGFVPYYSHSYFWFHPHGVDKNGNEYTIPINPSTGGHRGSSGGGCACACACACAGGGRAGCSRKDFYKPKVKIDDLKKGLNE